MALISPYQHMASEKTSTCDHQVNALSQQPNPTPTAIIENLIQYIERSTPGHSPVDSRLLSFAKLEKPRPSLKVKPLSYMKWNTLQSSPVDSKSAHYVKRNTPPQSAASEKKAQNQVTLRIRHTSPIDASPLTQANLETQYSPVDLKALGYIDLWLESSTPESSPRDQKLPSKSPLQLFKPLPTPPDSPPTICVELEGSTPAPMRDPPSPDGSHIVNFAELEGCTPQFLQSLEQLHRTSLVELPDSPTSLYDPSPVESKFTGDSELPSFTTSIDPSPVEMEQKKLGNLAGPKYYSLPPPEATKPFCKEEVMRRSAPHIAHLLEQKQQRLTKTEDSVVECSKPEIQAIIIPPPAQAQRQIEQHKILYPETKPLSPITESDKRRPEDLEVQHESQLSKAVAIQEHRRRYGREHGVRFKRGFFAGKKGIQMRMARRVTSMTKMEWVIENALGGDRLLKCFAQPNSLSRNRSISLAFAMMNFANRVE
jgi:hypothetical protein